MICLTASKSAEGTARPWPISRGVVAGMVAAFLAALFFYSAKSVGASLPCVIRNPMNIYR